MISGEDLCNAARLYGLCTDETYLDIKTLDIQTISGFENFFGYINIQKEPFSGYTNIGYWNFYWIYKL